MFRNPRELNSSQLMIALVALLREISARLGLVPENSSLDTLMSSLVNLDCPDPFASLTPPTHTPENTGNEGDVARSAPVNGASEAGSDFSILFEADGDLAVNMEAPRPFNSADEDPEVVAVSIVPPSSTDGFDAQFRGRAW